MRKQMLAVLCVVTLSVTMLAGCSYTQRGAAIGTLVGAGVGTAIGVPTHEAAEGVIIGAAAGGLAGALVGDQMDQKKLRQTQEELKAKEQELADRQKMLEAKEKELAEAKERNAQLEKEIDELRKKLAERGKVKKEGEIIVVQLMTGPHYSPGKAELTAEGMKELDRAVRIIKEQFPDREICVRGHTDSDPIKYSGWKSNWELGAARAVNALHYLMDKHGLKGEQISATTFSKYRPVADNTTAEGKTQNRRVEIVILPKQQPKVEKLE
jgi:chemotaxis protein MotB